VGRAARVLFQPFVPEKPQRLIQRDGLGVGCLRLENTLQTPRQHGEAEQGRAASCVLYGFLVKLLFSEGAGKHFKGASSPDGVHCQRNEVAADAHAPEGGVDGQHADVAARQLLVVLDLRERGRVRGEQK
jgi:hypothetical protein